MTRIRLRRDGTAPLRFDGRLLAVCDGACPGATIWHRLALYEADPAGYAVAIGAAAQGGRACRSLAMLFATLEEAVACLESHDPGDDIWPAIATATEAAIDASIDAAALAALRRDAARRYRIAVGRLLAGIAAKTDGTPEIPGPVHTLFTIA